MTNCESRSNPLLEFPFFPYLLPTNIHALNKIDRSHGNCNFINYFTLYNFKTFYLLYFTSR